MADIAKLVVKFEAETSRLTTELEKANRKLSFFEQSSNKVLASVKAGVIGFASAISVDALTRATKAAIEYGDAIAKTADKIGLSTSALQELRFAAERSGVSQGSLDMAMQRFSRRVGEAAQGTGELVKTLDQYGIKVRDAEGKMRPLDDILREYANTIQGAESNQEKLRLAFKAFDSEGAALVNMLRNGAAGLDELTRAARESDAVISDGLLRTAERMNDRWDTLTNTISVKFKSAILEAAALIEAVFFDTPEQRRLKDLIDDTNKSIEYLRINLAQLKADGAPADVIAKESEKINQFNKYLTDLNGQLSGIKMPDQIILPEIVDKKKSSASPKSKTSGVDTTQDDAHVQAYESYVQYLDDRVEALRVSLLTETELENEQFQIQMDVLKNAKDQDIETKQSYWELEQGLLSDHIDKLNEIQARGQSREQQIWESGWQGKLAITSSILGGISQLMNTESRKQFEIGKAAATAQAIIDTIASAQGAYKAMVSIPYVGPALAAAAAAAALAAGYARVQAIQSTQFGAASGGISSAGSSPAIGSAPSAPTEPPISADTERSTLTVQFLGDVYGMDDFQDTVIRTIRDAVTDKDEIIIRANSRQAVELR